jgi:DNA-directed RNA polymerase specialized sigma24 family protein
MRTLVNHGPVRGGASKLSPSQIDQLLGPDGAGDLIIRASASKLLRHPLFAEEEVAKVEGEDNGIIFELQIHLASALRQFRKEDGDLGHFMGRTVGNKARDLLRERRRAIGFPRHREADAEEAPSNRVHDDSGDPVEDSLEAGRCRRVEPTSPAPPQDLFLDVKGAIAELDPRPHRVCQLLGQGCNATEIAAELGVCLKTILREIDAIRQKFIKAGLDEYLGGIRSSCPSARAVMRPAEIEWCQSIDASRVPW